MYTNDVHVHMILFMHLNFRAACRKLWVRFTSMPGLLPQPQLYWYWLRCVMCRSSLTFPCMCICPCQPFWLWAMIHAWVLPNHWHNDIAIQHMQCVYVRTYFVAHLLGEVALNCRHFVHDNWLTVYSRLVCASCRDLLPVYQDICTEHLWSTASIMYCDRARWHPLRVLFYNECLTAMCTFQQSLCILYACPHKTSVHINYVRTWDL